MSFGAGLALATGNPIGAALEIFTQLISIGQQEQLRALLLKLRKMQSQFATMGSAGLFGSQVQRRKVRDRSLWQEIGYAEPADVPHLFGRAPAGTSFTVKDRNYPLNDFSTLWYGRRTMDHAGDLRFNDGQWWGSFFKVDAGDPIDTVPPIGRDGVHRHDFPPADLQRALAAQPRQYLGPRPLAGEDAEIRRAAFHAGGGSPGLAWFYYLDEQAKREGRRVRAWTGAGWANSDPAGEILDERTSTSFRASTGNPHAWVFGLLKNAPGKKLQIDTLLDHLGFTNVLGLGINPNWRIPPKPVPFQRGHPNQLTRAATEALGRVGFWSQDDFSRIPQIIGAT